MSKIIIDLPQRQRCLRCNRAQSSCFCHFAQTFETKTRFVILMHPREFKRQRTGTGRLTHISLSNSEIIMDIDFSHNDRLNQLLQNHHYLPLLLFPGAKAFSLSSADYPLQWRQRNLLVIILDATWSSASKMMRLSKNLQQLPQISFDFQEVSKFTIKRQPNQECLSTIEAAYWVLEHFNSRGLENLQHQHHCLRETLDALVNFQLACLKNPLLPSHRKTDKSVI